ncbi:hypothetical protein [Streptomyces sp. NPDC048425]|uniref:hypothetical protein n=1 Tax=Streptomyces sp. NPDC048425 TaxID=3365548 RepID=UPI00371004FF
MRASCGTPGEAGRRGDRVAQLSLKSILTGITPQGSATTFWSDSGINIRCDVIMGNE